VWTNVDGPSTVGLSMNAVAALSAHDAWAVGVLHPGGRPNAKPRAAVAHWNGSAWSMQSAVPKGAEELTSISGQSKNSIWVGGYRSALFGPTRVWHFNGHRWSAVSSHGLPPGITGKVVTNAKHVWLVGEVDPGQRIEGAVVATYHAAAKRWSVDDLSKIGGFIDGAAVGSKRAWAVGSTSKYDDLGHPLIASWNGRHWSVQAFPKVLGQLTSVAAHSSRDAVAVGFNGKRASSGDFSHQERGIAISWNGKHWRPMPRHAMGHDPGLDNFTALAAGPHHEYWAGVTGRNRLNVANYLHFKGGAWHHARSRHLSSAPANYFRKTAVAYGMARVPGTAITLVVGFGGLNYRDPPSRVVPFWEQTTA
jgi:hypothetical protein